MKKLLPFVVVFFSLAVLCTFADAANLWSMQQGVVVNLTVEHCDDNDCDNYDNVQQVGLLINSMTSGSVVPSGTGYIPLNPDTWRGAIPSLFDSDPYIWNDDSLGDNYEVGSGNSVIITTMLTSTSMGVGTGTGKAWGQLNCAPVTLIGTIVDYNPSYAYLNSSQIDYIFNAMSNYTLDLSSLLASDIAFQNVPPPVVSGGGSSSGDDDMTDPQMAAIFTNMSANTARVVSSSNQVISVGQSLVSYLIGIAGAVIFAVTWKG